MDKEQQKTLVGRKLQEKYCSSLRSIIAKAKPYPFLSREVERLEAVAESVVQQFNIAVFGQMKVGKSTLINALLRRKLAVMEVNEATATINRISHGYGERLDFFTVHWKDSRQEDFPLDRLATDWTGKTEEVKRRVSHTEYLELYSDSDLLKDIFIIDTPGIGSNTEEHEQAAQQFIKGKEPDTLVYVFTAVGKEQDEQALRDYRQGSLPGSSPYNSLGVMHKWDDTFWNSGGDWGDIRNKAARLCERMKDLVSEVIPVSAPLALFAALAPDDFFHRCIPVLDSFGGDEGRFTGIWKTRNLKWDKDDKREALRKQAAKLGLPMPGFKNMLRHFLRNQEKLRTPAEMRQAVYDLSNMEELRRRLDEKFIKRSAIISQQAVLDRTRKVFRDIDNKIARRLEEMDEDIAVMGDLYERLSEAPQSSRLAAWVDGKRYRTLRDRKALADCSVEISRICTERETEEGDRFHAVELREWLDCEPAGFTERQLSMLRMFLDTCGTEENNRKWREDSRWEEIFETLGYLKVNPNLEPATKRNVENLQSVISSIFVS